MDKYDIVKRPITTEKSELLRRENNTYTFEVDKRANKIEIKNAIESIFDVKVESVNTLNIKPKNKRYRMTLYKTPQRKKAIVKLRDGDSITYYEGV